MFVRWKKKALRRAGGGTSYHAQLVTTKREGERTRQQIVAHLGAYQERDLDNPAKRAAFWRGVGQRLKALGLPAAEEEQQQVRDTLARRVPLPLDKHWDADDFDEPEVELAGAR